MSEPKLFHLGDILSVTTGKLVSPRHMEGVYDVLSFMAGGPVWTHQIPRVSKEARPVLIEAMPWLDGISGDDVTQKNVRSWLANQIAKHGEMHIVPKMTVDQHERIDPISELAEKVHPSRIVVAMVEDPTHG